MKEMESQVLVRGQRTPDGSLPGIAFSDGAIWREQRKFAFSQLINLGFGKASTLENVLGNECDFVNDNMRHFAKSGGLLTLDTNTFIRSALMVVWHFMSGNTMKVSDELLISAKDFMRTQAPGFVSTLQLYSPMLMKLTKALGYKNMLTAREDVDRLINAEIENHRKSFDKENIRDFLDAYILKIMETTDPNSSFYGKLGEVNMRNSIFDLFVAGMDTTATTLTYLYINTSDFPLKQ